MRTIAIVGAGGNAREIAGIIRDLGTFRFLGFLADASGQYDSPILGDFEWPASYELDCLAMGIGAPRLRLSIGRALARRFPRVEWPSLVHPTAYVGSTCRLGRGVIVSVGAIATEHVEIGDYAQLNFRSAVGHEAKIGAGSLVNPGANVGGGVEIGEGTLIGSGATIRQYVRIGAGSTVGSGAVVIRDLPAEVTAVGVPAKVKV